MQIDNSPNTLIKYVDKTAENIKKDASLWVVFVIGMLFFYFIQRYLAGIIPLQDNIVFGADVQDTVEALQTINFMEDMQKHVLFMPTLSPIVNFFNTLPFASYSRSIRMTYALLAGLNLLLIYILMKKLKVSQGISFLVVFLFMSSFSILVIYGIPETYQMSNLLIGLYLLAFLSVSENLKWQDSILLSLLAGIAALYNYPLLSLMGIHLFLMIQKFNFKKWLFIAAINILIGILIIGSVNYLVFGPYFLNNMKNYAADWASITNFLNIENYANVFSNFLLFAIISPVDHLPNAMSWQDGIRYFSTYLGIILIVSWGSWLLYSAYHLAISKKLDMIKMALIAWVGVMMLFYVYFNPNEACLYASQTVLPILLICSKIFDDSFKSSKSKFYILVTFCLLLAINNGLAIYNGALLR